MKQILTISLTLLLLVACGRPKDTQITNESSTNQACASHQVGTAFPADDGCNSCSCDANGNMRCTLMACGNMPGLNIPQNP